MVSAHSGLNVVELFTALFRDSFAIAHPGELGTGCADATPSPTSAIGEGDGDGTAITIADERTIDDRDGEIASAINS